MLNVLLRWNMLGSSDRRTRSSASRPTNQLVSEDRDESGGETFVAVMQATDLWNGDDSSEPEWHDRARVWAILVE